MDSKLRNWLSRRPSLAGDSLPERIRSTTFAVLGFAVAAGLVLVLLFSRTGAPILSLGPLPAPSAGHGAVHREPRSAAGPGPGDGAAGTMAAVRDASLRPASATVPSEGALDGGPLGSTPMHGTTAVGHAAGTGAGQPGSGEGASGPSPATVIAPGQPPPAGPEAVPVSAPQSRSPVSGSSSSSGLFVRSSVVIGAGEAGAIAEGAPVSGPEPEAPAEPGVPVEPNPETQPPAEPASEPEAPPPAESESAPGAEVPAPAGEEPSLGP